MVIQLAEKKQTLTIEKDNLNRLLILRELIAGEFKNKIQLVCFRTLNTRCCQLGIKLH